MRASLPRPKLPLVQYAGKSREIIFARGRFRRDDGYAARRNSRDICFFQYWALHAGASASRATIEHAISRQFLSHAASASISFELFF